MEELNNKENQVREANARYYEYQKKYEDVEIKVKQEIELSANLRKNIEYLNQDNDRLKK